MKIKKIVIENYKSIKYLEFEPNPWLNAIIWENSVWKSNIFNAINWILGPMYPSFNSTMKQDHFEWKDENKIKIELHYQDHAIFELNEHKPVTRNGSTEIKSGLFYNNQDWNCKWEIRDRYCSAYLSTDREILDYLPSNKWTLIGRILQQINSSFSDESMKVKNDEWVEIDKKKTEVLKDELTKIRDNILFSTWRTEGNQDGLMDQFIKILQTESAKQLNREESSFSIDLSLYDPWNFYRTLQLLVKENDMDMQFQASALWMWVQASITIAILKAYAELNLPNKTPIFIDEPELFLHPQAQRNFYKILREMSEDTIDEQGEITREGLQIFYTTHSPNFLRTDKFSEIFIATKTKGLWTILHNPKVQDFVLDYQYRSWNQTSIEDMLLRFKNAYENTGDSQKANEAFFAKKIILVEGQSESLILPYFFDLYWFDYIKEWISIVRCWSKWELDRFFRLYNEFWIPCFILFDGDKQHEATTEKDKTIAKNQVITGIFWNPQDWMDGDINDRYLWFQTQLEDNLWFITSEKWLGLFIAVKNNITANTQIPEWVWKIVEKIRLLKTPISSILLKEIPTKNIPTEEISIEDIPF